MDELFIRQLINFITIDNFEMNTSVLSTKLHPEPRLLGNCNAHTNEQVLCIILISFFAVLIVAFI